jgi:uncharacterized protein (DUF2147 family)
VTAMARAAFAAMLLVAGARSAAADGALAGDVTGRWATPGVSAIVELSPCTAERSTLCGTIRWLWNAVDDKGRARLDSRNADVALRSRPLVGLAILSGLKPRQAGGWEGRIYNPEDGQTYRATVSRHGADTLQVEGCVLFGCQKQVWWKASVLAEALR